MCGICGFVKLGDVSKTISEKYLYDMNNEMLHRGPDGGNVWLSPDNVVGMGHRRLSIIDLSENAFQPMFNEDKTIVVTFNGEIYNHREIREELEKTGNHVWCTDHSDTEVIIHAYEEWGINCIKRFRGMFAIFLWDSKKKIAYAVRDRMGIKPFYYMLKDSIFTFASDLNALFKVMEYKPELNIRAVYDYMTFLCSPGEETIYSDILKLRPATIMEINISTGSIKKRKYWDVLDNFDADIYNSSEEDIIYAVIDELKTSVNLRKESDVPVGIFLSGGVDSSTNAVMFAQGERSNIQTFSIGYDKKYIGCSSEFEYARVIAEMIKSEHHELVMDEEKTLSFMDDLIKFQGEPIADPVCIPVYYLSKLARDNGVFVCQVGEGADELFAGYTKWNRFLKLETLSRKTQSFNMIKRFACNVFWGIGEEQRTRYEYLHRSMNNLPIYWSESECMHEVQKKKLFSEEVMKQYSGYSSFEAIRGTWEYYNSHVRENIPVNWMTYVELNHRLPELLLNRVDKMSMAASIECRVPFLDHKFVELCMSIPGRLKYKDNMPKYILKKAVSNILPEDIVYRKKQGFGLPVNEWFDKRVGKHIDVIIDEFVRESGFINTRYVSDNKCNRIYEDKKWMLYNLAACWKSNVC